MSILPLQFSTLLELKKLQTIIQFQLNKFKEGSLSEVDLNNDLLEIIPILLQKSINFKETLQVFQNQQDVLINNCKSLAVKIEAQTKRINHCVEQNNYNDMYAATLEIESAIQIINDIIVAHYSNISIEQGKNNILLECYRKSWKIINEIHIPLLEENIDEYNEVNEEVVINNNKNDDRKQLNEKMIKFPGVLSFISGFSSTDRKNVVLNTLKQYKGTDGDSLIPYSRDIMSMIPCLSSLNLNFTSEKEFEDSFYKFFNEGNWLETYIFLMIEKSGCSTRLLNVKVQYQDKNIEADVLALYKNKLYIFEAKDRWLSNDLSAQDKLDIEEKLTKIALFPNVTVVYVFNSQDNLIPDIKGWVENMAFEKGVTNFYVIFLNNKGLDNLALKIKECLK